MRATYLRSSARCGIRCAQYLVATTRKYLIRYIRFGVKKMGARPWNIRAYPSLGLHSGKEPRKQNQAIGPEPLQLSVALGSDFGCGVEEPE